MLNRLFDQLIAGRVCHKNGTAMPLAYASL